jgi:hypothetical protein
MIPEEVKIPPQTKEGRWCFNASVLVRKKGTNQLSTFLEDDDDTLEVTFRERIGADGLIYGCEMKPYTWTYSKIYPVIVSSDRKFEDPRLWLFQGKPHMSFSHYPSLLFSSYCIYKKEVSDIICLPIAGNGQGSLQKNWGFFEHQGKLCIVFLPSPLIVFEVTYTAPQQIELSQVSEFQWAAQTQFRGGSSPVYIEEEDLYYIFIHKTCDYNIWAIAFRKDQDGKWRVKQYTKERLNTVKNQEDEIHFVSGAIFDKRKQQWILTGGIGDFHCCFWRLPHSELRSKMTSINRNGEEEK